MFGCSSCRQRYLRLFLTHARPVNLPIRHVQRSSDGSWLRHRPQIDGRRTIATAVPHEVDLDRFLPKKESPTKPSPESSGPPKPVIYEGSAPKRADEPQEFKKADLLEELRWVPDPLKLADKVLHYLKRDRGADSAKAFELVKLASRGMPCTVSWNHVINHHMSKSEPALAFKAFNDMKKRAQKPDAHTFTILLNGLAQNARHSKSLERALSIYESMYANSAPVKPSLIHTNAMIKVCALSNDLDAMLGIAARLPTKGQGAPDRWTFTVILNAIRNITLNTLDRDPGADQIRREKIGQAVMQARRVWEEIRERWAGCDLRLDEELVCAMGRVLLMGTEEQDKDDILSLLEQTMQIPRQTTSLGHPSRTAAVAEAMQETNPPQDNHGDALTHLASLNKNEHVAARRSTHPTPYSDESRPFASLARYLPHQHRVTPGNQTLSLAIEACAELRLFRPAQDYWGLLTDPSQYDVEPDTQNFLAYLRLLRHQRQSRLSLAIVQDMHAGALGGSKLQRKNSSDKAIELPHKVFRIALSTCARDKNNLNALAHAESLVKIMSEVHERPDPEGLYSYLVCAQSHERGTWQTLLHAAQTLIVPVRQLHAFIVGAHAGVNIDRRAHRDAKNVEASFVKLAQKLISCLDTVTDSGRELMDKKTQSSVKSQKSWLITLVARRKARMAEWADKAEQWKRLRLQREGEEDVEGEVDGEEMASDRRTPSWLRSRGHRIKT